MSPKSRLISEVGEQVPCSAILANKFKLGENWYSRINGQLIVAPAPVEVDLKPERSWNYKIMDSITEKGIYSQNETDQMNKVITYNLVLPSELNNFIGSTVDSLYTKKSLFSILNSADVDEVKRMFTSRIWSFTSSVGEWVNFFVGVYAIFKVMQVLANTIINAFIISYAFGGCNYRIFFSFWDHLVSLFLHRENVSRMRKDKKKCTSYNVDDQEIVLDVEPAKSTFEKPKDLYPAFVKETV